MYVGLILKEGVCVTGGVPLWRLQKINALDELRVD
jgi:hypothetical protein